MAVARRRLAPEARRTEILEAAERLLRSGRSPVRVEDVVAEAGAGKGTFYAYFATWDDLLEALRTKLIAGFDRAHALPVEIDRPVDWPETMAAMAEAFVDFTASMEGLHEILFHGAFVLARPLPRELSATVRIAAMIQAGQEAGAFDTTLDPEPTARLVFAFIHEAADAVLAGEDRGRTMAAMKTLLDRALAPGGRS